MTENIIYVSGCSYDDIKRALLSWLEEYSSTLKNYLKFEIYKFDTNKYCIKVDQKLSNLHFYFLLNYLKYPIDIEYEVDVKGYTTGKEKNELLGQKLLVYTSELDKDGDNVYVVTDKNANYKIEFTGKIIPVSDLVLYNLPSSIQLENPEIVIHDPKEVLQREERKNKSETKKRFKILSFIAISLFALCFLLIFLDLYWYYKATEIVCICLTIWFFSDYKMLQVDKYYIYSILITSAFLVAALLVSSIYSISLDDMDWIRIIFPLTLLLVQWPVRKLFLLAFDREPIIINREKFTDLIYTAILWMSAIFLPILIIESVKKW